MTSVEEDSKALDLRRAGLPFRAIAEQMQFSNEAAARRAVERAVKKGSGGSDVSRRQVELDRLDRLQAGLWSKASKGDAVAVDKVLKIMELRSRLDLMPAHRATLVKAFNESVDAAFTTDADAALIESGRTLAERIDAARALGDGPSVTKALYLIPHLLNVLRELGATPLSRGFVGPSAPDADKEVPTEETTSQEAALDLDAFKRRKAQPTG